MADEIDWGWFAEKAAGGIVGSIAGEAFIAVFGEVLGLDKDYNGMVNSAVEEIETRVGRLIEAGFVNEWTSDVSSLRSSLLTYVENENLEKLENELEPKASDLTHRFMGLEDYRGLGIFMVSANLHLLSVKYLSVHKEGFHKTLNRLIKEYSEWGEKANDWTLEMAKSNVDSHCHYSSRFDPIGRPGPIDHFLEETKINHKGKVVFHDMRYTSNYKYNWGKNVKSWSGSTNSVDGECESSRRAHYDSIVTPAQERYEQLKGVIASWRDGEIAL